MAVDDVLLGDAVNGVVPAVVTFNATINSEVGRRNLTGSYIRLDLMKVDGEWRVDDMLFLASTDQQLDPAENPPRPRCRADQPVKLGLPAIGGTTREDRCRS